MTTQHPARYEGRLLPRPHEELVDQGLGFDLQTLMGRRSLLRALTAGGALMGLAACGSTSSASSSSSSTSAGTSASTSAGSTTEIPDETAGPYPGDGSNGPDVLAQSGVVRSDIRSSFGTSTTTAEGVPTTIEISLTDLAAGGAMAGAAVYVWHCDREGRYSMYSDGITAENYLRGVQIADSNGTVRFTSIFPACYSGRWPHIHFEVYPDQASITDSTKAVSTSQLALPKEVCDTVYATNGYSASVRNLSQLSLSSDNVFGDDSGASQLATVTGDIKGYTLKLTAGIDTRTEPTGGAAPGGMDGAMGGGGMGGGSMGGGMGEPPSRPS